MIGLDTNVLVRFLVQDDARQGGRATRYITAAIEADELLFINAIVLCETVWVLESAYGHSASQIADVIERLLLAEHLSFEQKDDAHAALAAYRLGKGDFADHLIGIGNTRNNCRETATFDRALDGRSGFALL